MEQGEVEDVTGDEKETRRYRPLKALEGFGFFSE